MFNQPLDYIHQNPAQADFVARQEHWKSSTAKDFCGLNGLIELS
jgi:hypothetical protein